MTSYFAANIRIILENCKRLCIFVKINSLIMTEEYKIDYTGIQVPDIESIKRTSQQFEN